MSRARSVEIYLKEGIEEDDQVHEIWAALRGRGRPQSVFRRALRLGLRAMAETGELPRAAMEALDPEILGPIGPAAALLMRGARAKRERGDGTPAAAGRRADRPPARRPAPAERDPAPAGAAVPGPSAPPPPSAPTPPRPAPPDAGGDAPRRKLGRMM
jgi:hypothetical protein